MIFCNSAAQACSTRSGGNWPAGKAAAAYLQRLIAGRPIVCRSVGRGRYGRILGRCSVGEVDINAVEEYLRALQLRICASLEDADGKAKFQHDRWERPGGGGGESRVLYGGAVFEQAGVGFSHVYGDQMPPSATRVVPVVKDSLAR